MKSRYLMLSVLCLTSMIIFMYSFTNLLRTSVSRIKDASSSFFSMDNGHISVYSLPLATTTCPIYTYYQPQSDSVDRSLIKVLDIWGYAFYAQGFRPVIINRTHAENRANFRKFLNKFSRFPTVNPAEYELSCYLRWITLAEQGGGLLMDYDILPMTSPRSKQMRQLKECKWGNLTIYASTYPMVTHGNTSEVEKWVNYMANFKLKDISMEQRKPHTSDMLMAIHAITHNQGVFTVKSALPFFHYSSNARHNMLGHIKRTAAQIMTRNQHIYHFLHHDIYVPLQPAIAPYSVPIVQSLTLCPGIIPTLDDLDSFCTFKNAHTDLFKLITVNGYWWPNHPVTGKCTWKTKPPDNADEWGILESTVRKREPLVIAILPHPKTYLWRLWLIGNPLFPNNTDNITQKFNSWALRQSPSSMLNALIPASSNQLDVDTRITRTINAMRSGQVLLMSETFCAQLHRTEGKTGIEKWISAHLGFFMTIEESNYNWHVQPVIDTDSELFSEDERFYSSIQEENDRWTKDWNNWRHSFLPANSS